MNHIEFEWTSPIWGPTYQALSERFHFTRFDQRGNGLSDWEVERISPGAMREDMEAVAEAAELDRFALFASSQGASFAIDYALAHPGKVSCIVFVGAYLRGRLRRGDPEEEALQAQALAMIRQGWGATNPLFRQFFVSSFLPEGTPEQQSRFDEMQRISTNAGNAARIFEMNSVIDAVDRARRLDLPALVLHARGDRIAPIEEGRLIARAIPGAEFVELPGANHVVLEGTPAFDRVIEESAAFVAAHP
jgi:pimeloyl-ACP methyl ester carboxylesterase